VCSTQEEEEERMKKKKEERLIKLRIQAPKHLMDCLDKRRAVLDGCCCCIHRTISHLEQHRHSSQESKVCDFVLERA
jgi:hypothetical protein